MLLISEEGSAVIATSLEFVRKEGFVAFASRLELLNKVSLYMLLNLSF